MEFNRPITALTSGLIDYAGLFPPAKLPLERAYDKYRQYRSGELHWMLDRFVCPWNLVEDLEQLVQDDHVAPIRVSAISPVPMDDAESFRTFLSDVQQFNEQSSNVLADAIEVKWTISEEESSSFSEVLRDTADYLSSEADTVSAIFIELPWTESFPVDEYARLASRWPSNHDTTLGLKVRTGGVEAEAFPEPEDLARFIVACYRYGVPFKATAGLHHPIRRWSSATDSMMHGFMNLFWGAAALFEGVITPQQLTEVLDVTSSSAFVTDDEGISWNGIELTHHQIADGRARFARSFGSCSFAEPVEDLQQLKLLPDNYVLD